MADEKKHELRYIAVDQIQPNSWNPQGQDEATFNRLVDEIREVGFVDPLEVVPLEDGTYRIIGGEHRWKAAQVVGLEELPCIVLQGSKWADTDLQKFVSVRVNILKGKLDPTKFAKLYNEMADKYGKEAIQQMMAFTDSKSFDKMMGDVKKGMKSALPKDMQADFDAKAKEAKSVDDLSSIVQNLFSKYGDTVAHSYMVFTFGKRQHLYVQMNSKSNKAIQTLIAFCRDNDLDMNAVIAPILETGAANLKAEAKAEGKAAKASKKVEPETTDF